MVNCTGFIWRADSIMCGVCGQEHSGCEIIHASEYDRLKADSAELAQAQADVSKLCAAISPNQIPSVYRCIWLSLRNALAQRDEALAKLAAIAAAVDTSHEEFCFGKRICIYGEIRVILQGTPEGKNA